MDCWSEDSVFYEMRSDDTIDCSLEYDMGDGSSIDSCPPMRELGGPFN